MLWAHLSACSIILNYFFLWCLERLVHTLSNTEKKDLAAFTLVFGVLLFTADWHTLFPLLLAALCTFDMNKTNYSLVFYKLSLNCMFDQKRSMLAKPFLQRLLEIFLNTFLFRAKIKTTLRNFWSKPAYLLFLDCLEKFGTTLKIFLDKTTNVLCGKGIHSPFSLIRSARWLSWTFPILVPRTHIKQLTTSQAQARPR